MWRHVRIMEIRRYTTKDFKQIASWWIIQDNVIPAEAMLSKDGFIISKEDKDICAVFLYFVDDNSVCFIGDAIADPESIVEDRREALDVLLKSIEQEAMDRGCNLISASSKISSVQNLLEQNKFRLTDSDMKQYWKGLN